MQNEEAKTALPKLDECEKELNSKLQTIRGVTIERKQFAVAVHYRNVSPEKVPEVIKIVEEVLSVYPGLRKGEGKMVLELQPNIDWHKGKAVIWLLDQLKLNRPDVVPFYLGDDITDENAMISLQGGGIGILVGDHGQLTAARYVLKDVNEAGQFLKDLIQ